MVQTECASTLQRGRSTWLPEAATGAASGCAVAIVTSVGVGDCALRLQVQFSPKVSHSPSHPLTQMLMMVSMGSSALGSGCPDARSLSLRRSTPLSRSSAGAPTSGRAPSWMGEPPWANSDRCLLVGFKQLTGLGNTPPGCASGTARGTHPSPTIRPGSAPARGACGALLLATSLV